MDSLPEYRFRSLKEVQPAPPLATAPEIAASQQKPLGFAELLPVIWLLVTLLVSLASVWGHMQIGLNNDHRVLMDEVRKLVDGATPYVDYTDVSPPLIHLLYVPPYLMSRATGIPVDIFLYTLTLAAIGINLLACRAILSHSGIQPIKRNQIIGTLSLALLTVSFIHQPFADRDHLLLVFTAPWLVLYSPLAMRPQVPRRWRYLAAGMAAVGFAIKPFFYVFYLATFAFTLAHTPLRQLLRQREQHIVWAFGASYLAIVVAYFPQYVFTILPVGLETYGAISWSWGSKWGVIRDELLGKFALTALSATLALLLFAPKLLGRTTAYLYVLLGACLLSYGLNFGWYYTQYPFMAVALVLTVDCAAKLVAACYHIRTPRWRAICLLAASALPAAGIYAYFAEPALQRFESDTQSQRTRGHPLATFDILADARKRLDQHLDSHPRFIFFNLDAWSINLMKPGTPRENVGRFDILWPLPGLLRMEKGARLDELSGWMFQAIASDIERHKPDMIINDLSTAKRGLPDDYDMMPYLRSNPRLRAALDGYVKVDSIHYCSDTIRSFCAYDVYYRK